jgi:perosamine synthetase
MKLFSTKFSKKESLSASKLIRKGEIGFGELSGKLEKKFKKHSGKRYNISTNSASASAFMIFDYLYKLFGACDIYTPSLAFTSPAWAAKHHGHNIIFVDVNDSLLFDSSSYLSLRKKNNKRKSIVMPILYGGVSDIPGLQLKGDEIVVVDSAHCVTPKIKSNFTFFSFHPYKPICSSDGGMISTDDPEAKIFFESYRNFGRSNKQGSYDVVNSGFKFYMNNLNACLALESLKSHKSRLKERSNNFKRLKTSTAILEDPRFKSNLLEHDANSSYYFSTIISNKSNYKKLRDCYPTQTHYPMLHCTKYFKSNQSLPNLESLHDRIVNIPLYYDTTRGISDMWADSIFPQKP